ncbi:neuronal acetylcholine receptor subunit alpha-9-II-like [Ylistrum balloti]|uniref:neuronal acetylcholine receptor subunit alpha-9-II-like n=1 Tax=Ylistrum balloti TaxID=509963 RepID=UPI002905A62F|nr:neuronal acetylcholine receptor subunit alpha-9-II-like [Ylistrum balloti]
MATLHTDLLSNNYSRYIRPVQNQDDAISVTSIFSMPYFRDFNAVTGTFTLMASVYVGWLDAKLNWNPANYGNIQLSYFSASQVWTPNIVIASSVESDALSPTSSVTVTSSGYSFALYTKIVTSACSPDITYYPYDVHSCNVSLALWEPFTVMDLNLSPQGEYFDFTDNLFWIVSRKGERKYISSNYTSVIDITYSIERRPTYLIYTIMLPVCLLNFVTLLAFVLPADSGERVSFATTMLLTLTMYMTIMSDSIPNTSDPVSIFTVSLMVKLIISALIVLSVIITLCIYHTSEDKPIPKWLLFCCKLKPGQVEAEKNEVVENVYKSQNIGTVATWQAIGKRLDVAFFILFFVCTLTETLVNVVRITYRL